MLLNPEERLVMAIVRQALQDLTSNDEEIREEARHWLFEDEEDFPYIIGITKIDPKIFRKLLTDIAYN